MSAFESQTGVVGASATGMLSKKSESAEFFGLSKTACANLTLNAKERVGLCAARREF